MRMKIWMVIIIKLTNFNIISIDENVMPETNKQTKKIMKTKKEVKKETTKEDKKEKIKSWKKYRTSNILLQKYIEKPALYRDRKYDVRVWVVLTHKFEVYAFKEGHLKACSTTFKLDNADAFTHVTNYSFQKYNKDFSKFEIGNEVSFQSWQEWLDETKSNLSVRKEIWPKMLELIKITFKSVKDTINENNRGYCFELFGFDIILDANHDMYLLEVNTNPGLEYSSPLIRMLVPRMIDDALRLTIDDIFESKSSCVDGDGKYISNYKVDGYDDSELMYDLVCDLNLNS